MSVEQIRYHNDLFRRRLLFQLPDKKHEGMVVASEGVQALGKDAIGTLIRMVADYNDFDKAKDPHHEHDFGAMDCEGVKYFWKIDYYDHKYEYGSENPADPAQTRRVLTIMRADEY